MSNTQSLRTQFEFSDNITQQLYEDAEQVGVNVKGFALWPSVQLGDGNTVSLQAIRNMIFANPNIPDEWAPETLNHITCALDAKNELKRSTNPDKFNIDWDEVPFSEDEHGKYAVERIRLDREYQERDERYSQFFDDDEDPIVGKPIVIQVNHMEKHVEEVTDDEGNVVDKKIDNYEYDDGIHIVFVRVNGTPDTDKDGRSDWQLAVRFKQNIKFPFDRLQQEDEILYETFSLLMNLADHNIYDDGGLADKLDNKIQNDARLAWADLEQMADRGRSYNIESHEDKRQLFNFMKQQWFNRKALAEKKARYLPFIRTLQQRFNEKKNEQYSSKQVRDVLKNILVDKMEARSIRRGVYFLMENEIEQVEALREGFQQIDERIRISNIPIMKFDDAPALNQGFETVREGLFDDLFEDIHGLLDELQERAESDEDTRTKTWSNRENELMELWKEYQEFVEEFELDRDLAHDMFEEAQEIIDDNMSY